MRFKSNGGRSSMELQNEFEVTVPVDDAWAVLTDIERIAPCLPGAELQEVAGDEFRGIVKVKVGPVTTEYRGVARFVRQDEETHTAVLHAEGRETGGQGGADATITARLEPSSRGTRVTVTTELSISGRAAQFGRGVLADVSTKLLGQFVDNLEATVLGPPLSEPLSAKSEVDSTSNSPIRRVASAASEPVDIFRVVARPLARRLVPVLGGVALAALAFVVVRRQLSKQRRRHA